MGTMTADTTPSRADSILARSAWRLVPLILAMYIAAFLNRVNVSFAALTMNHDLGFSPEVYGWGTGVFFLGYLVFEVPSNLIMERVGARLWLSRIMITWALVSMAFAFVHGAVAFFLLRFLLGLAEAGFYPGILLYFTYWFPAATRARILALFCAGIPLSNIIGAPLSGWLLGFEAYGLHGWQWMYILEGVPTLALGFLALWGLPDTPAKAHFLTPEEKGHRAGAACRGRKTRRAWLRRHAERLAGLVSHHPRFRHRVRHLCAGLLDAADRQGQGL